MTLGIVLSGGGARGAYEAGVLSYIFGTLAKERGAVKYDVIAGTSVGAVNGAFLAATAENPIDGASRLCELWTDLAFSDVLRFGLMQAATLYRVLFGGANAAGIFDVRPMADVVSREIPWRQLARNIRTGRLRALTISATHVGSGRTVLFVDKAPGIPLPSHLGQNVTVRAEHIMPPHVLASASIPILFPPIEIGSELYCDGGLRLNTPMAPALQLGADKLLVVAVSTPPGQGELGVAPGRTPGAPFLIGKVLNAFLLDHVMADLEDLERINSLLADAAEIAGPTFIENLNARLEARGEPTRRLIRTFVVRPSLDIGRLAGEHLRAHRAEFGKLLGRGLLNFLDVGEGADADLASYLLFDGEFTKKLLDLGRADAAARRDELEDFLFG